MIVLEKGYAIGVPVIIFFISIAINLRTAAMFKGLSFTMLIFSAVSAALFYPSIFSEIGGFDLKGLIVPLLIIIMFGMGCSMQFNDFVGIIKMPKGVLIGIICQFTIMPIVGYTLASLTNLPPEIQAGINFKVELSALRRLLLHYLIDGSFVTAQDFPREFDNHIIIMSGH